MATTIRPRGRMTRPLTTTYSVGDVVELTANDPDKPETMTIEAGEFWAGDIGIIGRIFPSAPNDGNATFLMFDVAWFNAGERMEVGESEMKPALRTNGRRARVFETEVLPTERPSRRAQAWLRRQLATLDTNEGVSR